MYVGVVHIHLPPLVTICSRRFVFPRCAFHVKTISSSYIFSLLPSFLSSTPFHTLHFFPPLPSIPFTFTFNHLLDLLSTSFSLRLPCQTAIATMDDSLTNDDIASAESRERTSTTTPCFDYRKLRDELNTGDWKDYPSLTHTRRWGHSKLASISCLPNLRVYKQFLHSVALPAYLKLTTKKGNGYAKFKNAMDIILEDPLSWRSVSPDEHDNSHAVAFIANCLEGMESEEANWGRYWPTITMQTMFLFFTLRSWLDDSGNWQTKVQNSRTTWTEEKQRKDELTIVKPWLLTDSEPATLQSDYDPDTMPEDRPGMGIRRRFPNCAKLEPERDWIRHRNGMRPGELQELKQKQAELLDALFDDGKDLVDREDLRRMDEAYEKKAADPTYANETDIDDQAEEMNADTYKGPSLPEAKAALGIAASTPDDRLLFPN